MHNDERLSYRPSFRQPETLANLLEQALDERTVTPEKRAWYLRELFKFWIVEVDGAMELGRGRSR